MKSERGDGPDFLDTPDRPVQSLRPRLHPGTFAFAKVDTWGDAQKLDPVAVFREAEGVTVVVPEAEAARARLDIRFTAAWITLEVDSDLHAIGLTARFANALANAGIACNVIAAIHHDHIFVPAECGARALACLHDLQRAGG